MITDKTVTRVPSHFSGVVRRLNFKDDEACDIGKTIMELEVNQEATGKGVNPADEYGAAVADNMIVPGQFQASPNPLFMEQSLIQRSDVDLLEMAPPSVRNMVVKHNLKLTQLVGTGRDGRIMKEDVLAYLKAHT